MSEDMPENCERRIRVLLTPLEPQVPEQSVTGWTSPEEGKREETITLINPEAEGLQIFIRLTISASLPEGSVRKWTKSP